MKPYKERPNFIRTRFTTWKIIDFSVVRVDWVYEILFEVEDAVHGNSLPLTFIRDVAEWGDGEGKLDSAEYRAIADDAYDEMEECLQRMHGARGMHMQIFGETMEGHRSRSEILQDAEDLRRRDALSEELANRLDTARNKNRAA